MRSHGNSLMSYSIAKKAIDSYFQLFNKARPFNKNRKPIISFYGGEPLINFKLIQKSTEYIKSFYRSFLYNSNIGNSKKEG